VSLIDRAEQLKKELTDKWVVVSSTAPELKRFASLTGRVKTVNMNCRALVEFDNGIDISWYDIEPGYLTVVEGPRAKKVAAPAAEAKPAPKPAAAPAASTAAPAAGVSPLDKIRAASGKPAAPAAGGSPLDKIRAAAKPATAAAPTSAAEPPAPAPAPAPKPAAPAAGGSPLDRIRAQGAAKKDS
jgi:pyruvate/2-oxoglutarate dehydrogenase complex dihydrolipoamide acyltransferase (E2) component